MIPVHDVVWLVKKLNYDLTDAQLHLDRARPRAGKKLQFAIEEVYQKGVIDGLKKAKKNVLLVQKQEKENKRGVNP